MMRLIEFIIIFGLFLIFIMFNLGDEYKCDVRLGFKTFEEIPVYLTAFLSFALGMLFAVPLTLSFKKKKNVPQKAESIERPQKRWGKKTRVSDQKSDKVQGQDGPYGID